MPVYACRPFAEAAFSGRISLSPDSVNGEPGAVERPVREGGETVVGDVHSVEVRDVGRNEFVGELAQMVVGEVEGLNVHHLFTGEAALLETLEGAAAQGEVGNDGVGLGEAGREDGQFLVVVQGQSVDIDALVALAGILHPGNVIEGEVH